MSNFGFLRLRVVNPYQVAFREGALPAVGASALLKAAQECKDIGEAVSDCALVVGTTALRSRELQHTLRPLEKSATLIRKQLQVTTRRTIVRFGEGGSFKSGTESLPLVDPHSNPRTASVHETSGRRVAVVLSL